MTHWSDHEWAGVFPATLCPFRYDESIDEDGLKKYIHELALVDGVSAAAMHRVAAEDSEAATRAAVELTAAEDRTVRTRDIIRAWRNALPKIPGLETVFSVAHGRRGRDPWAIAARSR